MKKLFLDSDVLLDLLLDRKPFSENISSLIEYCILNNIEMFSSPICIANINYIIEKFENKTNANLKTNKLLEIIKVENVGQSEITMAKLSNFKDFEDAIQNFCAVRNGHKIIVTRNVKDYKESQLSILKSNECLIMLKKRK